MSSSSPRPLRGDAEVHPREGAHLLVDRTQDAHGFDRGVLVLARGDQAFKGGQREVRGCCDIAVSGGLDPDAPIADHDWRGLLSILASAVQRAELTAQLAVLAGAAVSRCPGRRPGEPGHASLLGVGRRLGSDHALVPGIADHGPAGGRDLVDIAHQTVAHARPITADGAARVQKEKASFQQAERHLPSVLFAEGGPTTGPKPAGGARSRTQRRGPSFETSPYPEHRGRMASIDRGRSVPAMGAGAAICA